MKRTLIAVSFAVLPLLQARAAETPAAATARAEAAFAGLAGYRVPAPAVRAAAASAQAEKPAPTALTLSGPAGAAVTGTRTLRLSGYVSVRGTGFAPEPASFVTITVDGWTTLQTQDGRRLQGSVRVSDTNSYFANGNHASGWARPSAFVSIYEDGRLLGSTYVQGSIFVSGWRRGNWLDLSGSGYVEGTLVVND